MVIGAFSRLIPHIPNFTPTEGIIIFGVAYLGRTYLTVLLPLLLMYMTDFIINNTVARPFFSEVDGIVWYSNYMIFNIISLLLIVFITSALLKKITVLRIISSAFIASVVFYLVSNFGSLFSPTGLYTKDITGLMQSYIAGLPFFRTSLLSNLIFTSIIFGSYYALNLIKTRKAVNV